MAALSGGTRYRMTLESVARNIETHLGTLGWFDGGRQHEPIVVIDEFPDDKDEVAVNTLAFSMGDSFTKLMELGGQGETLSLPMFTDFFAENDGIGRDLVGDIYQHVQTIKSFDVLDHDQATPTVEFKVAVFEEASEVRKPTRAVNPWQRHWFVCAFVVEDERFNQ